MKTPLYNHNSLETAYMIEDYPYGRLRCRMRAWLEYREGKGFRYCTQTENPKNLIASKGFAFAEGPKVLLWNKPKASTYMMIAANMYIDDSTGHCEWSGVSEYTDHEKTLEFVKNFPLTNMCVLLTWALKKVVYYKLLVEGKAHFTMNGVKQEPSEFELEGYKKDYEGWKAVSAAIRETKEKIEENESFEVPEKF
jgi:hypothetical protein